MAKKTIETQRKSSTKHTARKRGTAKTSGKRKPKKKSRQIKISIWIVAFIFLTVSALVSLPYIKDTSPKDKGSAVPEGGYAYGIDISHYQPEIQWDSLMVLTDGAGRTIRSKTYAKDIKPVSFVFIKATEGQNMKDKHFRSHWENAGLSGLRRGAYHFFRSSKDGDKQAKHFIKTVGELRHNDLPPVLDIETIHSGCTDRLLNERALEWLRTIEEHYRRKPIVYSSSSFIMNRLCKEITENYSIWVAHYETQRPGYEDWKLWQFTDGAIVYGINGRVDLSVCRFSDLDKM